MCGIIAGFNTSLPKGKGKKKKEIKESNINDFIVNQYEDQHSRGQKGFGIIRIDKKGNFELDRACEGVKFLLDLYMKPATMIIAHHRTPTSTDNLIDQTHPMYISNKSLKHDYYVIHNGIISNDTELHTKHEELGFAYSTEYQEETRYGMQTKSKWNDSESIAIELALFIEGKVKAVGTDNNAAYVVLQVNKKKNKAKKVFFGRNGSGSMLNISKKRGQLLISSEGEGDEVEEGTMFSFHISDPEMKLSKKEVEFKGKPKESSYTYHHTSCECIKCKADKAVQQTFAEKKPLLPTTQSLLPETKPVVETTPAVTTEADKKNETVEVTVLRSWADPTEPIVDYNYDNIIYQEKNYKSVINEEFKGKIKDEDSMAISHVIDDALDEEVEKILELMNFFKESLLVSKPHSKEINFYLSQTAAIMRTMEMITDTADIDFLEKKLLEDQEEIADYNLGWKKGEKDSAGVGIRNDDYDDYGGYYGGGYGKRY